MIMQPEMVNAALIEHALAEVKKKKPSPIIERLRCERYDEGRAAQLLHLGPYAAEWPNVMRVHEFIIQSGHKLHGKHHEIYLGDPRRIAPEKLRTVLRQPFV